MVMRRALPSTFLISLAVIVRQLMDSLAGHVNRYEEAHGHACIHNMIHTNNPNPQASSWQNQKQKR